MTRSRSWASFGRKKCRTDKGIRCQEYEKVRRRDSGRKEESNRGRKRKWERNPDRTTWRERQVVGKKCRCACTSMLTPLDPNSHSVFWRYIQRICLDFWRILYRSNKWMGDVVLPVPYWLHLRDRWHFSQHYKVNFLLNMFDQPVGNCHMTLVSLVIISHLRHMGYMSA